MTDTGFTKVTDHFFTGQNPIPPVGDFNDGDEYWVTSDGTPTGSVTAIFKYEEGAGVWVEEPAGGFTCPDPMTIGQLRALRNAGDLNKDCHYIITNYNRGTVGAATMLLHAVDERTLSQDVHVLTTFDNVAWEGRYDIDANRLEYLADNLGNEVSGRTSVDVFPWGVATVNENRVFEADFRYTSGRATGNTIHSNAVVRVNSGNFIDNLIQPEANVTVDANVQRNTIGNESNVTISAGDFVENTVASDAVINSSTTGDVDHNLFESLSNLRIPAGNFDHNKMGNASNATVNGGAVTANRIDSEATIVVAGGQFFENEVGSRSTVRHQSTARRTYRNTFSRTANITLGEHETFQNEFSATTVNTTGSTGGGIRYCKFLDSFSNTAMQNIGTLDIAYVTISNNSQINANNALRVFLRYVTLENFGRLLVSAGARLDAQYSGFRDYSYAQVLGGVMFVNYSSFRGVSYAQNAATAGTNRIDRVNVSSNSRIRFLGTVSECRVYYSTVSDGSFIEHRGTSTGCYFYYCNVDSTSNMYSNNSVNLRGYYNKASGNSSMYSQNITGIHYMYYNAMNGHGYIWFTDAAGGRIYAVHCSGQGLLRFRGSTAAGRIYYSSFTAYYYLYGENWTVTRTGLHGYGRRTYTVTNPPNGTFTQNF